MRRAIAQVPAGRWGVAVSGGADSVALLRLLHRRAREAGDLGLVVVHFDHEMRGKESRDDAHFVGALAIERGLPIFTRRRAEVEGLVACAAPKRQGLGADALRRLRLAVFLEAQQRLVLDGILLAHHADDLAETLLIRLLRGSSRSGTLGMPGLRFEQRVGGARLLRPLLGVRRARLRRFLVRAGQPWREDASNALDVSLRNRLRRLLADRGDMTGALLALARSTAGAEALLEGATPVLPDAPRLVEISMLPQPLARRAIRRWLVDRGVAQAGAGPKAVEAVLALVDAAGPRGADLPGGVHVRRHRGRLEASGGAEARM